MGPSRGGFGSKLHLITDGHGVPLPLDVTAGQCHESTRCEALVGATLEEWPDVLAMKLAGDKAYSARRIRQWLEEPGIEPVIARRDGERPEWGRGSDRPGQPHRCCEKLAVNFLGTVRLAMIRRYRRLLDSSDRAWSREATPRLRARGRPTGPPAPDRQRRVASRL